MNKLDETYLTGFLTVDYGLDIVELVHEVNGRNSYMSLGKGDLIKVQEDDGFKEVTVNDVLNTTVNQRSKMHTKWNFGQSFYEGSRARVVVNPKTTKFIKSNTKKYAIEELFKAVESHLITHNEAMKTLEKWESNFED